MIIFWILAAGLLILALWLILPPLLRKKQASASPDQDALNLAVFEQRLKELEDDRFSGLIDEGRYLDARHDLERELLYDVGAAKTPASTQASGSLANRLLLAAMLATAIPVSAVMLYLKLGNPTLIDNIGQTPSETAATHDGSDGQSGASLEELVERLQERLKEDPKNLDGWLMLGRTYFATGALDEGLAAFERAYQLAPDQIPVMLAYAEALATASPQKSLTGKPAELIRAALEKDPQDPTARWLGGMISFQDGQFQEAVDVWQKILDELEPGSEDAKNLGKMVAEAKNRAGLDTQAEADSGATQPTAANGASVTVSVKLSPAIADQAAPEDTVFVFARAAQGPPMPLAVQRIQVKDLPASVTLDDSQAMNPALKLSSANQVRIGARVSKSGNATPQPGDLQGEAAPISPNETDEVSVEIDSVRP